MNVIKKAAVAILLSLITLNCADAFEISPSSIPLKQGSVMVIDLGTVVKPDDKVFFDDKPYPVYHNKAFIPVPVFVEAGSHTVLFHGEHQEVYVNAGDFDSINITLPKSKKSETKSEEFPKANKDVYASLCVYNPAIDYVDGFDMPVAGKITENFGTKRMLDGKTYWGYHGGLDISADEGVVVEASNGGVVELSDFLPVFGNVVVINHGQGFETIYMHMQYRTVQDGDRVEKGDMIGAVGNTGLSTGAHLHWGLYLHGQKVDPLSWLAQQRYLDNMVKN